MTARISAITMPRWGMTMAQGKVARWLVAEGSEVRPGMAVAEIETAKITTVLEASGEGILRRVVVPPGGSAAVGSVMAITASASTSDAEIDGFLQDQITNDGDNRAETMATVSPHIVAAGAHRLKVLRLGAGSALPVIFVHGFGGDLKSWLFNQPVIADHRVAYALDLPGHGSSSATHGKGSVRVLSEAVIALMDAETISRAHLVGHSMGGAISLLLAFGNPARVASVTGIAPGGLGPELNRHFIDGFIAADGQPAMTTALGLLFARPDTVSRTMVDEALHDKRQDGALAALEDIAAANFTVDGQKSGLRELLLSLKCPVQIIWGREDRIIPVSQSTGLPASIPVTVVDGAGHMPHMEKAAEVNRLISAFIAKSEELQ